MNDDLDVYIGRAVHMRMWDRGITQRTLAEQLGIGQSTMSKKLRGAVPWSAQELVWSAGFLGAQVADLVPDAGAWCAARDSNPEPAGYVHGQVIAFPVRGAAHIASAA